MNIVESQDSQTIYVRVGIDNVPMNEQTSSAIPCGGHKAKDTVDLIQSQEPGRSDYVGNGWVCADYHFVQSQLTSSGIRRPR